jgi:hypothetical protein
MQVDRPLVVEDARESREVFAYESGGGGSASSSEAYWQSDCPPDAMYAFVFVARLPPSVSGVV